MCFFPQFLPVLAVPRPVREGTGLCVSWGLPRDGDSLTPLLESLVTGLDTWIQELPEARVQTATASHGPSRDSYEQAAREVSPKRCGWIGAKKWMACVLILIPTRKAKLHYTPPSPPHTHTPLTVFEREFSGSITPQGLSQLDLCLCLSVCAFPALAFLPVTADSTPSHTFYTESRNSMVLINWFLKTTLSCQVDLYFYPYQDLKTK